METDRMRSYAELPPRLLGGALCLDYVNTVEWRGDADDPQDRLTSYAELPRWAAAVGSITAAEARRVEREASNRPGAAAAVLRDAVALREALARLLTRTEFRQVEDLALVNATLARAPARTQIVEEEAGFVWRHGRGGDAMEQPLWPVLWDAADLLTSDRLDRVRRCGDKRCGWLFLDLSRNRSRRWCAMETCGNRAKARRHYARHKTDED